MPATISPGCARHARPGSKVETLTVRHGERRVVPYKPMQMFDLVADVARYPEFLPWCTAARVRRREKPNVEVAELAIGFGPFHEKFMSRVFLDAEHIGGPRIDTAGIEGPFKVLTSRWIFQPHAEGTLIDFELAFEFRSMLLQRTVKLLFAEAVRRMVTAFEARATALYGKPTAQPATPASSTQ